MHVPWRALFDHKTVSLYCGVVIRGMMTLIFVLVCDVIISLHTEFVVDRCSTFLPLFSVSVVNLIRHVASLGTTAFQRGYRTSAPFWASPALDSFSFPPLSSLSLSSPPLSAEKWLPLTRGIKHSGQMASWVTVVVATSHLLRRIN